MSMVPICPNLPGLMFVALSVRTLRWRRALRTVIGDAGQPQMLRAVQVPH